MINLRVNLTQLQFRHSATRREGWAGHSVLEGTWVGPGARKSVQGGQMVGNGWGWDGVLLFLL